ncbi:hypothetical protein Tco_0693365, partial [Tanacetum coccineum]
MSEAKSTKKIDWNDPSVIRYHALKMKPKTIAQARKNMIKYLKNQRNYKISDFKGMSYNEIRPIFKEVWDFNQHIESMEHGSEKIEEKDADTQKEVKEGDVESLSTSTNWGLEGLTLTENSHVLSIFRGKMAGPTSGIRALKGSFAQIGHSSKTFIHQSNNHSSSACHTDRTSLLMRKKGKLDTNVNGVPKDHLRCFMTWMRPKRSGQPSDYGKALEKGFSITRQSSSSSIKESQLRTVIVLIPLPLPKHQQLLLLVLLMKLNWNQQMERELGAGYSFERKPCFVCGSLSHLIKDCDYYEKKMARVNKANQFTPRPVQLSNIRPNLSTARKTIKTGRVNVNTGHGKVNSGSVHVNSARVNRSVSNQTSNKISPKLSQVNLKSPTKCFSKPSRSPVNRPFSRNTAHKSNKYAVKGKMGTAVKTSAGCVWRQVIPISNTNSGPTPNSNVNVSRGPQGRPKPMKAWVQIPTPTPSHVQISTPPITLTPPSTQPPPLTQPVQSTTPPPQPSSVQLTSSPPPLQPIQPTPPITFSSPPITTIPDTQPTLLP